MTFIVTDDADFKGVDLMEVVVGGFMKSIKSIFHGRQWLMEMPDTSQISPKRKMFAEVVGVLSAASPLMSMRFRSRAGVRYGDQ
ncbi:MAG: hypothetical protein C5S48_10165 [Candidatus Methanogaster sp.]|nr:MAG: hypothetical protein C5S48_10165 [ANME-2 cluster archaeon]